MGERQVRIMLGFNINFTSNEVTKVALEHAVAFRARLYIVSSVVGHQLDPDGNPVNVEAQQRITRLLALVEEAGVEYEVHLLTREAGPAQDLLRFAEKHGMDEMVIGFKERSTIGEIVFGSNYRQLIGAAPCPIVTVHVKGQ